MYIAVLAPIATEDLIPESERLSMKSYPKGYEGAPLTSALIKEYITRGHKVLAITTDARMASNVAPFVYESGLLTFIVVPSRRHAFRFNGKRVGRAVDFYQFERKQVTALLEKYQPGIVHAHWSYEFAMAALKYDVRALITVHDDPWVVMKFLRTMLRFIRLLMAHFVFYRGKRFTTISPYLAHSLSRYISSEISIIPNPLTTSANAFSKDKPSTKIITAVMNGWDKRKNGERLLLAFKNLQLRHPDLILWAIGTAFEPEGEAAIICQQQHINNVVCWGKLPHTQVLEKLSASTIVLHTSLEESFGMILIEAMSYGIPIVAGKDSGAVPWVVQDGGLLVDVTNINAITEAVNKFLTDEALYTRTAKKAKETVNARFSLQSIADQYLRLYENKPVEVV